MQFGTDKEGNALQAFTLASDTLGVRVTNFGARLLKFAYGGTDMLYGPKTAEELQADTCYCGSICGRVANRIAMGRFCLGGKEYPLAANNGPNHLHGGNRGFSDRVWTVEEAASARLVLSLVSPDGEEGYPGTVQVRAVYTVQGNELSLLLEGRTDAPTLLNLTNHAYWNLSGTGTVDAHLLKVNADAYTPMAGNIPTGAIEPVAGTLYDLTAPACLGERFSALSCGYDDNYVLPAKPGVKDVAELTDGKHTLTLATDAPGLQVYTGDYLPLPRGGVALEAQNFPDSPHRSYFPSIELEPGQVYRRTIVWRIR